MLERVIKNCKKFNGLLEQANNGADISDDDEKFLSYFNLVLAKSILEDMDSNNSYEIGKILLAVTDDPRRHKYY